MHRESIGRNVSYAKPLLVSLLVLACTASSEEVSPPRYDPYFPTGLVVSPDEKTLFVLSANSDLRYDSGTILAYDLAKIDEIVATPIGTAIAGCEEDFLRRGVRVCKTTVDGKAASMVVASAGARVGDFGSALGLMPLESAPRKPSGILRLFATVRGDPSLTYVDFDPATGVMSCGGDGAFQRCDAEHRIDTFRGDAELGLIADEPLYLSVDSENQRVLVTHLTSGRVTLASAPPIKEVVPTLVDTLAGLFLPPRVDGSSGVAVRNPADPDGPIYVTSRGEARVATVHVVPGLPDADGKPTPRLARGESFFLDGRDDSGRGNDARAIAFSPDGERAYIVNRSPSELLVFDTSLDASGLPKNVRLGAVDLCPGPATLAVVDTGEGLRVYVPCFSTGQVWTVDPDRLEVVDVTETGKGPTSVAGAPMRQRLYVTNFAEDTIAVIDTKPHSPTQNHTLLRVGKVR
jgi:DNA-binding beta-propeller fold protein YncE